MSPLKMAIAVAVTMAATAGTGGMKKVTGTSSAVAMVAVRPGNGADEQAVQRRQRDHQQHVGLEDQPEGGDDGVHRRGRSRTGNTPQGSGTRSSL
jgi:hypothetical protein